MHHNNDKLKIHLFGRMRWHYAGNELPISNKKLCALVAYLAMHGPAKITRERLVGVLWSDVDEERARASLRQIIKQLRKIVIETGFSGFVIGRDTIELKDGSYVLDTRNTIENLSNMVVDQDLININSINELILSEFDDLDPSFRVWLYAVRQQIHSKILNLSEGYFNDPNLSDPMRTKFALVILNLDPSHEPVCRYLMLQKYRSGDVAGALRVYNALWELLRDEYDMEPTAQTVDLVANIKLGHLRDTPNIQVSEPSDFVDLNNATQSIAVEVGPLPTINIERFEDAGVPENQFHVVRGFRHSLLDSIARFRELRVADSLETNSSAKRLNDVTYSLQGTSYVADEALNLILTMKEVKTQILVWSDRFKYEFDSWPQIHHRVLSKVAMTLSVQLSAQKLSEMLAVGTISGKAYEQWLYGQSLIMNFDPASWRKSENIFRALTVSSPNFSPAYSSLAQLGNTRHIAQPGVFRTEKSQAENLAIAKLSAQIDPVDSRSHLSLAWAYAFAGYFEQSHPHFELAIELNEFDHWTAISAAQGFAFLGDHQAAKKMSRHSLEMAYLPSPPYWGYHAGINFMCGDYEDALSAAKKAGDSLINNGMWRAASHLRLGNSVEVKSELNRCIRLVRSRWIGDVDPNNQSITNWMAQLFPIKSADDRARLNEVFDFTEEHGQ